MGWLEEGMEGEERVEEGVEVGVEREECAELGGKVAVAGRGTRRGESGPAARRTPPPMSCSSVNCT